MAPSDGSSATRTAAELRHTVLLPHPERHNDATPPPSHSNSSGSLSQQDGTSANDRSYHKGLSGLKQRVLSRLTLSDAQLAKDVVSAQPGMRVTLDGLSYTVRNRAKRSEKLRLLQDVNALFHPASMAAIMGPSGSGKTTLLDVLAGRKTQGEQAGRILFAGQKTTRAFLKRFTGYVEQFDTLLAELSVREMLMYTAELKRPVQEPISEKRAQVEHLLEVLGLQGCADTHIGDVLSRGISGGQAKRTNIGIALISNPSVLFLDEPTSGLDSYTAHQVMKAVKRLEKEGITICATIHCPSIETFRLFDRVLLLQHGRVVYHGDNGAPVVDYFVANFSDVRRKSDEENLAEWLVEITVTPDADAGSSFAATYDSSDLKAANDAAMRASIKGDDASISADALQTLAVRSSQSTPMWKALWVMLKYRTTNNYVSGVFLLGRVFDKLVFSALTVIYYWKVGRDFSPVNVPNIAGVLFLWVIMPAYGAAPYLPAIVLERPVYLREMSDGLYSPFAYLLYKMIEELFLALIMSLVFALPAWYLCIFQGNFAVFWLAWLLSLADGIAFAYATAALSPSMDVANAMFLTIPGVMLFACGYLIRYADIKAWLKWATWTTWMWYHWGALMINQFEGRDVLIFGGGEAGGGTEVLAYYSLDKQNEWAFLGYSCIFFFAFIAAAYAALVNVKHQKR